MSSAFSESSANELRAESERPQRNGKPEARSGNGRHNLQIPQRRARNVRPLPVAAPPRVVDSDEAPPSSSQSRDAKNAQDQLEVQARRPSSMLKRSSRARGVGTVTTLIMGMLLVIVLAVALLFALDDDNAPSGIATNDIAPNPTVGGKTAKSADKDLPSAEKSPNEIKPAPTDSISFGGITPAVGNSADDTPTKDSVSSETAVQRRLAQPVNAAALAALPTSHIVDDGDAERTGEWHFADRNQVEFDGARYHGEGFRIDSGPFSKRATAQYVFPPLRPGNYLVSISYPAAKNRASNARITVVDADGRHVVEVDQTVPPERGKFFELGQFRLDASRPLVVRFDNEGAVGRLAIDAVKAENLDVHPDESGDQDRGQ